LGREVKSHRRGSEIGVERFERRNTETRGGRQYSEKKESQLENTETKNLRIEGTPPRESTEQGKPVVFESRVWDRRGSVGKEMQVIRRKGIPGYIARRQRISTESKRGRALYRAGSAMTFLRERLTRHQDKAFNKRKEKTEASGRRASQRIGGKWGAAPIVAGRSTNLIR